MFSLSSVNVRMTLPVMLVMLGGVFMLGATLAQFIQPDPAPEVVTKTKTEVKTKTVTEYKPDPDCLRVSKYAEEIVDATGELTVSNSEMLRIMSELRMAIFHRSTSLTNELETDLRKASSPLISAVTATTTQRELLRIAIKECENQ
jgi:hypothetical protein